MSKQINDKITENLNTDWWFNYMDFYKNVATKNYNILVEVGVWKGHSISYLAKEFKNNNKTPKIYAVDLWEETYKWSDNIKLRSQVPYLYDIYTENKKQNGVNDMIIDLKGLSWEMANNFKDGEVDFVFIDADHTYESVVKDINAWLPKIKKGGMISGHDYNNPCGVKKAVVELIKDHKLTNDGIWFKVIE
jgi:predicted O-methyltransferase YrrM